MKEAAPNRLIHEKSPYLLQHAHNPVDWHPWGDEAFAKARKEAKPIFLSIGYSTCHWCHVMERESFSDPAVAQILNEHFVSIKVDREERPDVDHLYMQFVMEMTGQGGWPMNVFLTPELKPFYGGTYFPPEDRWGKPGLKKLLLEISDAWANKRQEILRSGEELTQALSAREKMRGSEGEPPTERTLAQAFHQFSTRFDDAYGGFSEAPKFPTPHALSFLLRYWKRTKDAQALFMVEKTLQAMDAGGIHDHLGGGFHRYSTDSTWHVPHFEKMLYDQALLAKAYLETVQATGRSEYADVARQIFEYVLRDMISPEGAFYSAEDADSAGDPKHPEEKREGAFYVWTEKEIRQRLGPAAESFCLRYGVKPEGNVLADPNGEFKGENILYLALPLKELAQKLKRPEGQIQTEIARARGALFEARKKRPRPHLDDKILADWNGLMISSLALGSRVLEEPRYREAAERSANFILSKMIRPDGRLLHRYRAGEAGIPGTLNDYAFFIHGLVGLYEATFKEEYLARAKSLTADMLHLFWDEKAGGFFIIGQDAQPLLVRQKELYDGAIPSGNSVAALDLIRVGRITMDREFEAKAEALFKSFSREISEAPLAYPQLLAALDFAIGPSNEIVVAADAEGPGVKPLIQEIFRPFIPNKVVAFHPSGKEAAAIEKLAPYLKEQTALEGKPTVYVCENYACNLPVTDPSQLRSLLND